MPEASVLLAAYGSAFAFMSFFTHILVRKEESTGRYKFIGDNQFTSNAKAAAAILLTVVVGILIEEFVLQPYLISLYEQHVGKIIQLLLASLLALFLTIWYNVGITDNGGKQALFALGCMGCSVLFIEGFGIITVW